MKNGEASVQRERRERGVVSAGFAGAHTRRRDTARRANQCPAAEI